MNGRLAHSLWTIRRELSHLLAELALTVERRVEEAHPAMLAAPLALMVVVSLTGGVQRTLDLPAGPQGHLPGSSPGAPSAVKVLCGATLVIAHDPDGSPPNTPAREVQEAVEQAATEVGTALGLAVEVDAMPKEGTPNRPVIAITWMPTLTIETGRRTVLGRGGPRTRDGLLIGGHVQLAADAVNPDPADGAGVRATTVHELLHVLGLPHRGQAEDSAITPLAIPTRPPGLGDVDRHDLARLSDECIPDQEGNS